MHLSQSTSLHPTRAVGLFALLVALLLVGNSVFVNKAHAQHGGCGVTWSTPFTIEPNPFPPYSPGYGVWQSMYGQSRVVYFSFQVASFDPDARCDGGEDSSIPTAALLAVPSTINSGQQSSLSWGGDHITSCTGNGFNTGGATAGTVLVSPAATTNYSVTCTDGFLTANAAATITVTGVTASLTATPGSIDSGSAATLSWNSSNASVCVGNGFATEGAISGTVSTGALSSSTNYSVTCTGEPATPVSGTWQYSGSDTSDLTCPITTPDLVYRGVATCPANPTGKVCSGVGSGNVCKINTVSGFGVGSGSGCFIDTVIYTCQGGTAALQPPSATASASVAVTSSPICTPMKGDIGTFWSNATTVNLWTQGGENASNGGGLNDRDAHLASCKADCDAGGYNRCNFTFVSDLGSGQASQTRFICDGVPSGQEVLVSKDIKYGPGNIETSYAAIERFGSCPVTGINLTAGPITPTTATVGTSVTLSSLITNAGTLLTPTGFTNLFQIDNDTDHTSVTATRTTTSPALAPSTGNTAQTAYTFPTAGTWYARACADNNASWVGAITESNEADNCGPWTQVAVANSCTGASCLPGGGTLSCSVSPTTLTAGGSSTWTASPSGLGTYTWTPSETSVPIAGTQTLARTYASAGTYAMSLSAGGATASCTNSVTVGNPACGVAVPSISASPTRVQAGSTSVLTVSASGVDGTCTVTGPGVSRTISGSSCSVPSTTIATGAITSLSTYTISCDNGEATSKVFVNVVPKIQEF